MKPLDIGAWLEGVDAELAQAMREALEEAVQDVMHRPTVDEKRILTLKLELTPSPNPDTGVVDAVNVHPVLSHVKKPAQRRTKPYEMLATHDNGLKFHETNPYDVRQGTLFEPPQPQEEGADA